MGPPQVLLFRVRVDLGVMAMKVHSIYPRSPELETHHQMKFSVTPDFSGSYPSARDAVYIQSLLDRDHWRTFYSLLA